MKKYGHDLGRLLEIRIEKHPEGQGHPTPFSLVIKAQYGDYLHGPLSAGSSTPDVFDLGVDRGDLDKLRETIVQELEAPSLKQLLLRLQECLDQLARHVGRPPDHR